MRNILKYGSYRVGASSEDTVQSVNDLITMRLDERDQKFIQKVYTLDELRDLESKLVLICGSKEESRTEVDHFLNVRLTYSKLPRLCPIRPLIIYTHISIRFSKLNTFTFNTL